MTDREKLIKKAHNYIISDRAFKPLQETMADFAAEHTRDLAAENARLKAALIRLRDCDWIITLPDRMDAVRAIAREALDG